MLKQNQNQMMRIFIIGTTAVGKTKLSVELAKYIGGQIISCDSKQLYLHASIMTAKVTEEQAQNVPHYMVDCLELHENTYNRNKYYKEAFKAIETIEGKQKVPIIVGGTNYYIETLLYNLKNLDRKMSSSSGEESEGEDNNQLVIDRKLTQKQEKELQMIRQLSKDQRYDLLLKYDPQIANKTHRNDEKRITSFLERIIVNKEVISQNYDSLTGTLRNKNTLVFWLRNSDKQQLQSMVTKRIYKMLDKDGLSEIFSIFYYIQLVNKQKKQQTEVKNIEEYSGACSSIGIREFKDLYLEALPHIVKIFKQHEVELLKASKIDYPFIHEKIHTYFEQIKFSKKTLEKCRDELILDTKHYCKRQLTWIRNRMFVNTPENRHHFFVLELSQQQNDEKREVLDRFERQIANRAKQIIDLVKQKGFEVVKEREQEFQDPNKNESLEDWKKYFCQPCNLELNGLYYWNCHINSKRHVKQVKYFQKKDEHEKYVKQQKQLAQKRKINKLKEEADEKIEK